MEVKLVVKGGKNAGQEVPVTGAKFFVGRAEDCQLRPNSDLVSRHHCAIIAEEGFVAVRDFGSKNGTFVNGERIKAECELKSGDRLQIGPLDFEVQLVVEVSGKKKPKVHSVQEAVTRTVESSSDDDIDLSDWLDDEPANVPTADTQMMGETQPVKETVQPVASFEPETEPEQVPQAEAKPKEEKEEEKEPVKVVGRFDSSQPSPTATSRAAASDVLREFFNKK